MFTLDLNKMLAKPKTTSKHVPWHREYLRSGRYDVYGMHGVFR